ncbi:protein C19orf12 homolog isoform X5 [Heptranchias perlo]|uniref:protein C19orf12 homolog isoform X5 n=1 Tax=Heptranchias perlo TaxID=212740 RepID=UPI00355A8D5B
MSVMLIFDTPWEVPQKPHDSHSAADRPHIAILEGWNWRGASLDRIIEGEITAKDPKAGGVAGGLLGAWMTTGQFKPFPQIIMELTPNQQLKLSNDVHNIVRHLDWTDAVHLISLVMGNATLKQQVLSAIKLFVSGQLNAQVRHSD